MKNGPIFVNFLGAIKDSLIQEGYSAEQVRHLLVANLMEIVNDTVHENGKVDHYVMKPVYRFLINIQKEETRAMRSEAYLPQIQKKMADNEYLIQFLESELSTIEKNEEE